MPSEFVPLAEQTGFIRTITQWVLERAIAQCAEWRNRGLPMNIPVNIAANDLINSELPTRLAQMLEKEGCSARWITLEVTENAIVGEPRHALKNLEQLKQKGLQACALIRGFVRGACHAERPPLRSAACSRYGST